MGIYSYLYYNISYFSVFSRIENMMPNHVHTQMDHSKQHLILNQHRKVRPFSKRIYIYATFKADTQRIFDHFDGFHQAVRSGRVSKTFAEKIMLVVTQVNGCRYCNYGHSRAALAAGVSETELQDLLALEFKAFPIYEVTALNFAQHYAEANGQPDLEAWQQVVTYYGEDTAHDILAYIRMITFGNLLGNTFDALLSRIKGNPAGGSSLWSELSVLLGVAWMPVYRMALQRFCRKGSESLINHDS
jgi:AhpD family alkylhydroperoxidase